MNARIPADRPTPQPRLPQVEAQNLINRADSLGLDPDTTDGNLHYRWVGNNPAKIARHKFRGYHVVKADEGPVPVAETEDAADGTIRNGDMVLMAADRSTVEARRKQIEAVTMDRTKQPKRDVRRKGRQKGIRTFTKEPGMDDHDG